MDKNLLYTNFKSQFNYVLDIVFKVMELKIDWMQLIGWKDRDNKLLVDPEEIKCVSVISKLNENANSVYELYQDATNVLNEKSSIWKETVLSSSRPSVQMELKASIQSIESK